MFSKGKTQMPNNHMRRFSVSLSLRKIQIRTAVSITSCQLAGLLLEGGKEERREGRKGEGEVGKEEGGKEG